MQLSSSDDEYGQPGSSTAYQAPQSSSTVNVSRGFGQSQPSLMDASEPFAQSGAVPAGFAGPDDKHMGEPMGKGYGRGGDPFDDDEGPSAYSFSTPQAGPYSRAKRGKWATFKENHLTDVDWTFGVNSLLGRKSKFDGVPREISLNDPAGNKVKGFENNSVSTGKYGPITFLPKFLFCKPSSLFVSSNRLIVSRVLQICQFVFPVHGVHSTSTWRLADRPVYHNCPPRSCHYRQCFQGDTRRLCEPS